MPDSENRGEAPEPAVASPKVAGVSDTAGPPAGPRFSLRWSWWWLFPALLVAWMAYTAVRHRVGPGEGDPVALMNLSLRRAQAHEYQGCVDAARQALKLQPNNVEAYNNIGWCSASMGQWDDGIQNIREALRIKPDFQLATNNLAWMLAEKAKGSGPPAPAAPLTPADSYLTHSLEHAQAHRYQECVDTARQALKLQPNSAEAYNNIGFCLASTGQWDEGIRNMREALRIKPDFQLANNNLAWMLAEKAKAGSGTGGPK